MQNKYTRRIKALGLSTALCCLALPGTAQGLSNSELQVELAANYSRNKPSYVNKSLNEVLTDLRSKFGIQFSFSADVAESIQLRVPASLEGEKDAEALLNKVLLPAGLNYKKVNEVYIIQKAVAAPAAKGERSFAPERPASESRRVQADVTVTGQVTDETGVGLPGVTVVLQGTSRGTSTDYEGNYTIAVPSTDATLVFSYIGYTNQEVQVGNQTTINVTMSEDAEALEEVVIVGYGTQRKSDLTGTVTAVSEEEFQRGNIQTPEQLIAGKVAGVQITSSSGAPGAGSQIRIRGGSSLSASNDPLVVIDGVPVDNQGISGTANPLSLINPNDIESFNILRDASATAIYGSRASNGVIIITTKKGEAGQKLRVNFSSLASLSYNPRTIDVLRGDEYRAAVNQYASPGNRELLGEANTDWQELLYRNAWSFDNNLSVSGTIKSIPYRVSVGYLDQDGVLLNSNMKRASGAVTLNPTFLDDHLKVNLNVRGVQSEHRFVDEGAVGTAVNFDPTQPVYADNEFGGYFEWVGDDGIINLLAPRNPLSTLEQTDNTSNVSRSIGNLQLDYKFHFLPALRANLNLGYDVSQGEGEIILPATLASVYLQGGSRSQYEQNKTNNLLDFYLNYTEEYEAIRSRVDLTAGYSYQKFNTEVPAFPTLNMEGDTITQAPRPNEFTNVLISYFGRLNYTFRDKYLFTATLRRDGSSRFSPDTRWGMFPALALAWRIADEPFMQGIEALSDLKLRLGYGLTGQQDIGSYYPYLPRYAYSNAEASYQLGDQFYRTLRPAGYDENIKWEETETYNIGLDFGVLNNKFSGTVDFYYRRTNDLLAFVNVPAGANLTNQLFTNVGSLENRGVEFALNYAAISNENLTWDLGFNATYNQNEITSLGQAADPSFPGYLVGGIGGGVGNTIQINSVGYPRNSFYVYKQVYTEDGAPIERLYADLTEDGSVTDEDFYRYQSPDPDVFLGFTSQLNYRNWNFGFVFRGNIGNYVYNNIAANAFYNNLDWPGYLLTIPASVRETNFVSEESERLFSDYFVENASFLRLDNINLGYDFGRIMNDKASLRLSATGQNLLVITNYSGLDPEVAGGIDNAFYPRPRIFSLGLNLSL
ncbi:TonB-dependent receptor [Pontibacter diazotrophicus]|uniref:TonB-dependent receptor n=1 Tax=Pontibacter diazotrophicus TaxID=1400979 RepID=A0A3D8LHI6_9BACT|nr:TonB-dependent receptor [Pontibacter diazotrophicus]RDV16806.1 TonB-dependent receptor [Pontibacter diazotrophicus]